MTEIMDEVEIKHEFNNDFVSQCQCCLSVGRRLLPLGELTNVYRRLTSEIDDMSDIGVDLVRLCWECEALLRKVQTFRCHVKKANELLQLRQNFIYGPFSCLTTVVLNDVHPNTVYINETNLPHTAQEVYIKNDNVFNDNDDSFNDNDKSFNDNDKSFNDNYCSFNDNDKSFNDNDKSFNDHNDSFKVNDCLVNDEVKSKQKVVKRIRNTNKWATKKAQQNKKAKFKIIKNEDDVFKDVFVKVGIHDGAFREGVVKEVGENSKKLCERMSEDGVIEGNSQNQRVYACDICKINFPNKRHLAKHVGSHYSRYQCVICEFTCTNKSQTVAHCKKEHERVFQCLKCHLKFGSRREFFKHYKEWHEKFICDYCGISFKMRYCIKDHIRKQHSPFECKPCRKRFARYNGLWLHNKTRHTATQPAYCVECDKGYADIYRYRWHLANSRRHTPRDKMRVPCPGCDKIFSKNIYMKDHYNLVHLKYYKYRCEQCDKNFIRNADLVKHKRRVHEGILPPKNKICFMCGRGFSSNKILTNHLRTHTGERPFACTRCGATFAQNTALAAHTRALHSNT